MNELEQNFTWITWIFMRSWLWTMRIYKRFVKKVKQLIDVDVEKEDVPVDL